MRAVATAQLWQVLAAQWAIPMQGARDLGGSLNLDLLVHRGDERLVVRVHLPSVSPARLAFVSCSNSFVLCCLRLGVAV